VKTLATTQPCPCGREARTYGQCCAPFLEQGLAAPDAHALMRSRYSAFVLERSDYLLRSWHPTQRPPAIDFEPGVRWLGLEVRAFRVQDACHATVEFVARQKPASGPAVRLHEHSRFEREGLRPEGVWLYVDGDQLPPGPRR
jgi:SEC-C motif domain protein